MRTAIYVRISEDTTAERKAVQRQEEDARSEAAERGWEVAEVYCDNDTSATRSKVRPEFKRMLADIRSGTVQAVIVWDGDRLSRTPREGEDLIDLHDSHGLQIISMGGARDLSTPTGRRDFRNDIANARYETDKMARRLKRKFAQNAAEGKPHGRAPYGFQRVDGRDVPDDENADVVRLMARFVLARYSLRTIAAFLNEHGVPGPEGPAWNTTIIRQVLLRPANAGLRQHRGVVVGNSNGQPILDMDTFEAVRDILTDPSRKQNHAGPTVKYLLGGIAVCGRCGGPMRRVMGRMTTNKSTGAVKRQPPAYQCSACFRVRRKQSDVDAKVEGVMIGILSRPEMLAELAPKADRGEDVKRLRAERDRIDVKLNEAADQFAADELTGEQLKRITAGLRERRVDVERHLKAVEPQSVLHTLTGADAAAKWKSAPLEAKREAIAMLATVTILPSGPGRAFDPDDVRISWRTDAVNAETQPSSG